jgi:hypothetical protein
MRLPGRVSVPASLGALLAGRVEGALGLGEAVIGGIERAFCRLHRGQGIGKRVLGRAEPAPQLGQLPDRLAAFPRLACHPTIIASGQGAQQLQCRAWAIPRDRATVLGVASDDQAARSLRRQEFRRVFFRAWRWSAAILLVLVVVVVLVSVTVRGHEEPGGFPTAGPPTPIWPIIGAIGGAVGGLSAAVSTIIAFLALRGVERRAVAISGSTSQEPQTQAPSEAKTNDRPHSAPPPVNG